MDINHSAMTESLNRLLHLNEKIRWPVYAMVKKSTKRVTDSPSEKAYIAVTTEARLLLYRFDPATNSSYSESYPLSEIMMGDLQKTSQGVCFVELSFLVDGMQKDVNFTVDPKPRGMDFPNQETNLSKLEDFLEKLM